MQKRNQLSLAALILVVGLVALVWFLGREASLAVGRVGKVAAPAPPFIPAPSTIAIERTLTPAAVARDNPPARTEHAPDPDSPDGPATLRQMRDRIDRLVQGHLPLTPAEVFKHLQEPTQDHGAIQTRSDAVMVALEENDELDHAGVAYYFPSEGQFYLQWDVTKNGMFPNPDQRHFYGPFPGDPYSVLGLPPPAPANAMAPANSQAN